MAKVLNLVKYRPQTRSMRSQKQRRGLRWFDDSLVDSQFLDQFAVRFMIRDRLSFVVYFKTNLVSYIGLQKSA